MHFMTFKYEKAHKKCVCARIDGRQREGKWGEVHKMAEREREREQGEGGWGLPTIMETSTYYIDTKCAFLWLIKPLPQTATEFTAFPRLAAK